MIFPGRFNDVAVESNHWESLCPNRHNSPAFWVGRGFEEGQVMEMGLIRLISLVPRITMLLTPARRPHRKAACWKTA
jgi:hypothetical protein